MLKYLYHGLRILLDTIEMLVVSVCIGPLVWIFGVAGTIPRFELYTCVCIALWMYVMYCAVYEMYRHIQERAAARLALFFLWTKKHLLVITSGLTHTVPMV